MSALKGDIGNLIDVDALKDSLGTSDADIYMSHILDDAPIIEPDDLINRAAWILEASHYWSCSDCKGWSLHNTAYCPNCGARMENGTWKMKSF